MDNKLFEIIASIVGLALYFFLTSRKPKAKKTVNRPVKRQAQEETYQPHYEDGASQGEDPWGNQKEYEKEEEEPQEYMTFEDLLEQFTKPQAEKKPEPKPYRETYQETFQDRYERERQERLKDETPPLLGQQTSQQQFGYLSEFSKATKNLTEINIEDMPSPDVTIQSLDDDKETASKYGSNKFRSMLRGKDNIKKAIILKEILDSKHF